MNNGYGSSTGNSVPLKMMEVGKNYNGIFLLNGKEKRTSSGGEYLFCNLADSSGEVRAVFFGLQSEIDSVMAIEVGSAVMATIEVSTYNNAPSYKLAKGAPVTKVTDPAIIAAANLVKVSPVSPQEIYNEMLDTANSMVNPYIRQVTLHVLEKKKEVILTYPAGKNMHHSGVGELALHEGGMLRVAKAVVPFYASLYEGLICPDLVYAGVILHDIMKQREFDLNQLGTVADYSDDGNLLGHIYMGAEYVGEVCKELHVPDNVKKALQHMVLSHHGTREFGSPVVPLFFEATLLNLIDLMDSRGYMFNEAMKGVPAGHRSEKIYALDNIRAWNHGLAVTNYAQPPVSAPSADPSYSYSASQQYAPPQTDATLEGTQLDLGIKDLGLNDLGIDDIPF